MNPSVKDLCELTYYAVALVAHTRYLVARMMPNLRNYHEKVQEASINLIGRTGECQSESDVFFLHLLPADREAEFMPA